MGAPLSENPARTTPQQKLERILDAAASLFAERGFAGTPVDEIAQRAGVSKGLVYVHFPSKEALLEAVLEGAVTSWFEASIRAASVGKQTVPEMIASSLRASIDYARRDGVLRAILGQDPRLILNHDHPRPDPSAKFHAHALANLIRHGIQNGQLRKDIEIEPTAIAIALMHAGLIRELFISPRLEHATDGDDVVDASIDLMLSGLIARHPTE